jgi:hypothetical protein
MGKPQLLTSSAMSDASEPAPKRRKVQDESIHQYICIAQAVEEICLSNHDSAKIEQLDNKSIPVLLKDTQLGDGTIRGHLSSAIRKISLNVQLDRPTSSKNLVGEMLRYCHGLESIHTCKEDKPLLVCSEIILKACYDPIPGRKSIWLEVNILWQDTESGRNKVSPQHLAILHRYMRSDIAETRPTEMPEKWNPRDFYENVHVPAATVDSSTEIVNDVMSCRLYPFQSRAVRWLLHREGVKVGPDGHIQSKQQDMTSLPPSFFKAHDAGGQEVYVSQLLGCVSSSLS